MAASQSPRRAGEAARLGEDSNPAPVIHGAAATPEQANLPRMAAVDRCAPSEGAAGGHGPLAEPRRWRIDFPAGMELLTSNQSKNWGRMHRIGTVIKDAAIVLCRDQKIPLLPRASFVVEYQPPTKGRAVVNDAHNLAPSAKYGIDGCVKAGVLKDDSDRYVADVSFRRGDSYPLGRFSLILTEVLETS